MTGREAKLTEMLRYLLDSVKQYTAAEKNQHGVTAPPRSHLKAYRNRIDAAVVYTEARLDSVEKEMLDEV